MPGFTPNPCPPTRSCPLVRTAILPLIVGVCCTVLTSWAIRLGWVAKFGDSLENPVVSRWGVFWPLPALDQGEVMGVPVETVRLGPRTFPTWVEGINPDPADPTAGWGVSVVSNISGLVRIRPFSCAGMGPAEPVVALSDIPRWSILHQHPTRNTSGVGDAYPVYFETAVGWPFIAMYDRIEDSASSEPNDSLSVPIDAMDQLLLLNRGSPEKSVRLPLTPVWPGFFYNTLFYAALSWLVIRSGRTVQHRVLGAIRARRDQCPRCAYPVPEFGSCPECGHAFRPDREEAVIASY